jgi:hypothetical protein
LNAFSLETSKPIVSKVGFMIATVVDIITRCACAVYASRACRYYFLRAARVF